MSRAKVAMYVESRGGYQWYSTKALSSPAYESCSDMRLDKSHNCLQNIDIGNGLSSTCMSLERQREV